MLSREELQLALKRVTYRPGWEITLGEHPFEGNQIRIKAPVEDSYNPGTTTILGIDTFLPPMHTEEMFFDWLLWRLERVESHECREWFKIEDKPWKDPHAEGATDG